MYKYGIPIFDPRIRLKVLDELIYPSITRSSWRTEEEKIRALFRHKIRVGKSIGAIEDAQERKELYGDLDALYIYYLSFLTTSSAEVEKCEREVKAEYEVVRTLQYKSEPVEEVTSSVNWIKARTGMLFAQVMKRAYMHRRSTREELDRFEDELSSMERRLSNEPDSQVKADIFREIERVRVLLLSV